MSLAKEQPLQILVQLVAPPSPSKRLRQYFRAIAFNVLAKKRERVFDSLVDLAHAAASSKLAKNTFGLNAHLPATLRAPGSLFCSSIANVAFSVRPIALAIARAPHTMSALGAVSD
jgi:hypothetical protein